jgi:hypothetical protein
VELGFFYFDGFKTYRTFVPLDDKADAMGYDPHGRRMTAEEYEGDIRAKQNQRLTEALEASKLKGQGVKSASSVCFMIIGFVYLVCSYAGIFNEFFDQYHLLYCTEWALLLSLAAFWGWEKFHTDILLDLIQMGLLFTAVFLLISRTSSRQGLTDGSSMLPGLECKTFGLVHLKRSGGSDTNMIPFPTDESNISKLAVLPILDDHPNDPAYFYHIYSDSPIGVTFIPSLDYFTALDEKVNPLHSKTPANLFHAKITGFLKIHESSQKKFWIHVDDFVSMKIDGVLVAHGGWQVTQSEYDVKCSHVYEYSFLHFLDANRYYFIEVDYTNIGGQGILKLFWEDLNATKPYIPNRVPVPRHVFFHVARSDFKTQEL